MQASMWNQVWYRLVNRPTRLSLLFIFGFLCWSSYPRYVQRNIVLCYARCGWETISHTQNKNWSILGRSIMWQLLMIDPWETPLPWQLTIIFQFVDLVWRMCTILFLLICYLHMLVGRGHSPIYNTYDTFLRLYVFVMSERSSQFIMSRISYQLPGTRYQVWQNLGKWGIPEKKNVFVFL